MLPTRDRSGEAKQICGYRVLFYKDISIVEGRGYPYVYAHQLINIFNMQFHSSVHIAELYFRLLESFPPLFLLVTNLVLQVLFYRTNNIVLFS